MCITTNQPDTKSNLKPDRNPTTIQHAMVSIQLNIITGIQRSSYEAMFLHRILQLSNVTVTLPRERSEFEKAHLSHVIPQKIHFKNC